MTKFPLTWSYLYLCDGKYLKTAKDYGHDNLGESYLLLRLFNYSPVTESKASNQGSAGAQSLNEL